MFAELLAQAVASYKSPRQGARAAIDSFDTVERVAILFGIAFSVSAAMFALRSILFENTELAGGVIGFVFSSLVLMIVNFGLSVGLILAIGRLFGGVGGPLQIAAVVAWHSLVTSPISLFVDPLSFLSPDAGAGAFVGLLLMGASVWLFVNFVAEAHRFTSAWRVAGVMFGALILAALVLQLFIGGPISPA